MWYVTLNHFLALLCPEQLVKSNLFKNLKSSTYVPSAMIIGCFNVLLVTQIFGILDHSGPFSEPFAPIARKKVNIKTQKRNICQQIAYHNFWLLDVLLGTYPWWRVMLLWGIFWPLYHSSRNKKSKFSKN